MRPQRYVGVDFGEKRIGLAKADDELMLAVPFKVFEMGDNHEEDMAYLVALIKSEGDAIVMGLPLSKDGTEGPMAKRVREFADELQFRCDLPVHFQDERMTTRENVGLLQGMPTDEAMKLVDALAAASILQTWLDRKKKRAMQGPAKT